MFLVVCLVPLPNILLLSYLPNKLLLILLSTAPMLLAF